MQVAGKLLLAFLSVTLVVLAVNARGRVAREKALFEADMRKDAAAQAIVLARGVELLLAKHEADAAAALVQQADKYSPHLHVRLVELEKSTGPDRPAARLRRAEDVRANRPLHVSGRDASKRAALFTYVGVDGEIPGRTRSAIEIEETLDEERSFVTDSITRSVEAAVAMFGGTALVATLFGTVLLGRPLRSLRAKARRAGAGDFTTPLVLRQNDELRELADELNVMCDRLAESRRKLEQAHAERIAALEQVRRADRLATVGQLAAGVAHELGTPLGVVAGRAKMIASGEHAGNEANESARIVAEQADRITSIVRQLLDFSRKRRPEKAAVDLHALVREVVGLLTQMAHNSAVTLAIAELDPGAATGFGDAGQLQQALINIVVNAIQASSRHGRVVVSLGRQRRKPPADHHGDAESDWICLAVTDHGCGMDAETIAHVFEPFYTTKQVGEGTGLGLAVAHGIVAEHGGFIDVESELGKGSRFAIYLPEPSQGAAA